MSEAEKPPLNITVDAKPPFSFGIGLRGELVIGWVQETLPDGRPVRMHLAIPAEQVAILRYFLEENKTTQETLAATPPTQSFH